MFVGALLLAEPDFGAATVLFATGFGMLFLAGARLRYVIAMTLIAGGGLRCVAVSSSYRMRRLTTFLNPWADPYNSGDGRLRRADHLTCKYAFDLRDEDVFLVYG